MKKCYIIEYTETCETDLITPYELKKLIPGTYRILGVDTEVPGEEERW